MKETKISITSPAEENLVGIEVAPEHPNKKNPAVILVHGLHATKNDAGFNELAQTLAQEGIYSYRFDFSGCGESEGNYHATSLQKRKEEFNTIFDFVFSQPTTDTKVIGVLGQSFGSTVVISLERSFASIILTGSTAFPKELLITLFGGGYNPNGTSIRIKSNGATSEVGPQFWKDIESCNMVESIKKIHSPILFIHGEKDEVIPASETEILFDAASEPKKKMIVKGMRHNWSPHETVVSKAATAWFKEYLF